MKANERLFEMMGEVDEEYIAEAAEIPESKPKNRIAMRAAALAAGLAVIVGVGTAGYLKFDRGTGRHNCPGSSVSEHEKPTESERSTEPTESEEPVNPETPAEVGEPPKLSTEIGVDGMGFEGFWASDVAELTENNPWTADWGLTELPVFGDANYLTISSAEGFDEAAYAEEANGLMEEKVRYIAEKLGCEYTITERQKGIERAREEYERIAEQYPDPSEIHPMAIPRLPFFAETIKAQIGGVKAVFRGNAMTELDFPGADDLPEEYKPYSSKSYEEGLAVSEYLGAKYGDILGYSGQTAAKNYRDYNFEGESNLTYAVYEESDDPLTCLLNYNFRTTTFYFDGHLKIRSIDELYRRGIVGTYPIITEEQAFERLMGGDYSTTVWTEEYLPDGLNADEVMACGVVYRKTAEAYYMPYYRYLVQLHGGTELPEGLKEYGAFYVPAVATEYLENMETKTAFN